MKRRAVVAVAVCAAVLLVGGGAAWWWAAREPGPEAIAHDFLDALADGDGARAVSLFDDTPDASTRDALSGAASFVTDPVVVGVADVEDGTTRAEVTFDLGGTGRTAAFGLIQTDAGWRLAPDALGALTPATTIGDAVRVGGVLHPADSPARLLPAVYDVVAAPEGALTGSASAVVLPGSTEDVEVEAVVSSAATASAQSQLDAYARRCTAPATTVPAQCGIRVPWAADLDELATIAFRIDEMPVLTLSPDARTFAATGGIVVATATGRTHDGTAASFTYRADDWALRGTVAFTGDEIVLSVD